MLRQAAARGQLAPPLAQVSKAQNRIDKVVVGRQLERVHPGLDERGAKVSFALRG
jgi:hypothetical protein